MPFRSRASRPAMYNTPAIRNGGFGALQLEAITNRPLSIARRHLAASQLRMQDIEPHELSSSEWLRFLAMEERERERWMQQFRRRRRNSDESTSSADMDRELAYDKAEEAREEAEHEQRHVTPLLDFVPPSPSATRGFASRVGTTPAVVAWARHYADTTGTLDLDVRRSARPPLHSRHTVGGDAPPTYSSAVRARTPPPAYHPEGPASPPYSPTSPRYE
ncbi:hypothetical protein K431DRAFT_225429 [Polychaeton citri CBS 116435]|uniref:Uncharacterized protein n=1 Tax=Polychaeton citri CBS 116435 TaxID=1314669 RepID=A0A9P4Q7H9_9PEZI|nr:hypothetical protein K431DRAFT_225429 [Polychaeton citri CBS 116435]